MKVKQCGRVEPQTVLVKGAKGCTVRWLLSDCDGASNFAMRQFEVAPGGHTPKHSHPYEHEVYVLEGAGVALEGNEEHAVQAGDVVFVGPDEVHQFRNPTARPFKFLCLVPRAGMQPGSASCAECQATAGPRKE